VARLGSAIHGAFAFVDSNHAMPALRWQHMEIIDDQSPQEGPGDYSQVLPHRIAFGSALAEWSALAGDWDGRVRFCSI
jgi:hypothetical protein